MSMTPENQAAYASDPAMHSAAYAEVKRRFSLRAAQRDLLDASPFYSEILNNAHLDHWLHVDTLLRRASIIAN